MSRQPWRVHVDIGIRQQYSCLVAIDLQANGNLPPGIHLFTWPEFVAMFGWNQHRQRLLDGLGRAINDLKVVGCHTLYVDGSFATEKEFPADFDACWERAGMDMQLFVQTPLASFDNRRAVQKAAYGGELFPAEAIADGAGTLFLDFFQVDKNTGDRKGVVMLDLRTIP